MRRKDAAAAGVFVVLSIVMTWPLARQLGYAVAEPGDPYINIWILDWDWWALLHQPLRLFDANIFHPARWSLAFSENLLGIALFVAPLRALGVPPVAAFNVAMIAGYAFSGWGAYLLGRKLTGSAMAGFVAGVFHAFVPYRFTHITHLQQVWGGWLPLLLAALVHYAERPSRKRAAMFGAVFVMNGLSNIHFLLFGAFAAMVTALVLPARDRRAWRQWLPLAAATLLAVIVLLPVLWPYVEAAKTYGMTRNWHEARGYSARAADWLRANAMTRTYRRLATTDVDPERRLFPGALSIVLGAIGAVAAARSRDRRALVIALLWLAIGFLGSLGTHTFFHRFLFAHVPGFRAIRVPARWAFVAFVGLSMLIAMAAAALARSRSWIAAVLALAFLIELRAAPIRWYLMVPEPAPVYRWLAAAKPAGGTLELPLDVAGSEYAYMLRATAHHRPILNGVSGFAPPTFRRMSDALNRDPIGSDAVDELRRLDCTHVIVHADFIDDRLRAWLARELAAKRIRFVRRFDGGTRGDWLFTLRDDAPVVESAELKSMLENGLTENHATFGTLDTPAPGATIRGAGWFSGWAFSPDGIRGVDVLLDQGRIRIPAELREDAGLSRGFHWYPNVPKPRFIASLPRRPAGVPRDTDLQVEITDGRGAKTRLEGRWVRWE